MRFEDYVRERGQSLLRLAYVLTGDAHRAEDLTQTVLATAFRSWSKVESARYPDAYVRRMLVNSHLDWHRRRSSTELPTGDRELENGSAPDLADGVASRDQLRQALAALSPRARTVLVLRYYSDLDDNSVAEVLGISSSAVRSTVSRSLATLRRDGVADALKEVR